MFFVLVTLFKCYSEYQLNYLWIDFASIICFTFITCYLLFTVYQLLFPSRQFYKNLVYYTMCFKNCKYYLKENFAYMN